MRRELPSSLCFFFILFLRAFRLRPDSEPNSWLVDCRVCVSFHALIGWIWSESVFIFILFCFLERGFVGSVCVFFSHRERFVHVSPPHGRVWDEKRQTNIPLLSPNERTARPRVTVFPENGRAWRDILTLFPVFHQPIGLIGIWKKIITTTKSVCPDRARGFLLLALFSFLFS